MQLECNVLYFSFSSILSIPIPQIRLEEIKSQPNSKYRIGEPSAGGAPTATTSPYPESHGTTRGLFLLR